MTELLPFVIAGVATGSLYGLAGMGLVLTYRTSGVFNFAHGALAAAAAYLFFTLHFSWGWPWPLAALVSVFVFGPLSGIVIERLVRRLAGATTATLIVATIGLLLFLQGFLVWRYRDQYVFPEFLPTGTAFTISEVQVSWTQVLDVAVGVVGFVVLSLFLRRTRLGVAMRAVVADPDLLALAGTGPGRVRVASWVVGSSFAALTGILIAPIVGLDVFILSALVVQAFGAVAIGRFSSVPLTYLGGLAVGVIAALATKYFGAQPPLNGLPSVVPFLVLIAVMLATPARKLPKDAGATGRAAPGTAPGGATRRTSQAFRAPVMALALGLLVAVPSLVGTRLAVYSTALVFVILFASLSFLNAAGEMSLAHASFAGIGAATFSNFTHDGGYPWLVGLLAAGLITAAVGALVSLPAMRLSGIYLALATLGFGLLMDNLIFPTSILFGANQALPGSHPDFGPIDAGSDTAYYYVALGIVLASCAVLVALRRARVGRFLRAMADSPTALNTMGLGVNVTRVIVFSVSAFFAGIAGALYITEIGSLSALNFSSTFSLLYLAVVTIAGTAFSFVPSAFVAAALLIVVPSYLSSVDLEVQSMIFGLLALAAAVLAWGRVDWRAVAARARTWARGAVADAQGRRPAVAGSRRLTRAGVRWPVREVAE